jgi:hypothetical protein
VLAVDGTKVHANASQHAARDYEQIAKEILEEAKETDELEDELYGEKRGDELPPELSTEQGRRGGCARPSSAWREACREPEAGPAVAPGRLSQSKRRLEESCGRAARERCL